MNFPQSELLDNLPEQFFASLVAKVNAQVAAGVDVINLGQGNPDKPTPDYIIEATQDEVTKPGNHKYAQFRGQPDFKQAAAKFYAEKYHAQFDSEKEVAVLGGSKIGLVELPWALMNPGDLFLLPDPGYPDYLSGAALGRVNFETVPLKEENNFLPDLKSIPEATAKKAKFFYINYPNNPTGAVATKEFYEELVAWAKKYNVGIISDFAYGAIGFDGKAPISFMETPGAKEVGIEFYTFRKLLIWPVGGWHLQSATLILLERLISFKIICLLVFFRHYKRPGLKHYKTLVVMQKLRQSLAVMKNGVTHFWMRQPKLGGAQLSQVEPSMS